MQPEPPAVPATVAPSRLASDDPEGTLKTAAGVVVNESADTPPAEDTADAASELTLRPGSQQSTSPNGLPSLSESNDTAVSPSLSKSDSRDSGRVSVKSHVSLRAIGTIPYGQLRVHQDEASDSEVTEKETATSGLEEAEPHPPPACLEKGDVFRILDLPSDFVVGLDAIAMTTNQSLPGFREIPPGAHFLWVQQPGGVSRCGYWFVTGAQGIVRLKQWDGYNEVLGEPASQFEARDQRANIEAVYPTLKPYALLERKDSAPALRGAPSNGTPGWAPRTHPDWEQSPVLLWRVLTEAISSEFLGRITGKRGVNEYLVDSTDWAGDLSRGDSLSASRAYVAGVSSELNFLFAQDFRDLQLLDRGPMKARVSDTSARVQALLSNNSNPITERDILAELQFTFITGLHLSSSACLEQWWNLVLKIVLRAYSLAVSRPALARDLLQTLHAQLFYAEHHVGSSSSSSTTTAPPEQQDSADDGTEGSSSSSSATDGPGSDRVVYQYKPQNREKLRLMLAQYKRRLNELLLGLGGRITPAQQAVGRAFEDLEAWLWRYRWDLRGEDRPERDRVDVADSEDEDDPPVVVELDEAGREVGLVSFRD
ncbi:hypothetical protein VTK56DRAFT_8507 [Thermocarpiscus australiensis]